MSDFKTHDGIEHTNKYVKMRIERSRFNVSILWAHEKRKLSKHTLSSTNRGQFCWVPKTSVLPALR